VALVFTRLSSTAIRFPGQWGINVAMKQMTRVKLPDSRLRQGGIPMRSHTFVTAVLLVGLSTAAVAISRDRVAPARQWAIVYLTEPTLIMSTIVEGPVLFSHDAGKMDRGEPCTTVRLVDPSRGPLEEIASFHCTPTLRSRVGTFTIRTRPNLEAGFGCVLTEYQFAGDTEGHGVPAMVDAH
jgi:hypothetical protein